MIRLFKGQTAPRDGKFLTENEYNKLQETIYISELNLTLSKDEVLQCARDSLGLIKAKKTIENLSAKMVGK